MELEPRILADCINRLLDSLNRISIFVITAALTAAAAVLSQNILTETTEKTIAIYSYKVPLLMADLIMGGILFYFRTDFLDKFVLLRQVVTEQQALAAVSATIIPYHPWRYNPIFPGPASLPASRIGSIEKFLWLYEFIFIALSYAVFRNVGSIIAVVLSIFLLKIYAGTRLFREIRRIHEALYPQRPLLVTRTWIARVYIITFLGTASAIAFVAIGVTIGNKLMWP